MNTEKDIYFDNSATTPLCEEAKEKLLSVMKCYGNPSSLHAKGQAAHALLEEARSRVLSTLGTRPMGFGGMLLFTASGTESDNLALVGCAHAKERRKGGRVISTASEHPGVENALIALEKEGFEVVRIPTRGGELDWDAYIHALNEKTFLVSIMAVNNETGAAYDLRRAFSMAKAKNPDIVTHTDAVQGYLKMRLVPSTINADLVSISAHKIRAPKGVGALYISPDAKRRRDLVPIVYGGGQESGFRSGTENILGISAFGAAACAGYEKFSDAIAHMTDLRTYAEEKLADLPVKLHIPTGVRAPHILNLALPDIKSETMVHALSSHGISVSSGSACAASSKNLSRALLSFGLSEAEVECSVRLSFGPQNTKEEIDIFADALSREIDRLVKIHR